MKKSNTYMCIYPNQTCSTLDQSMSTPSHLDGEVCTSAFKDGPKRTDWAPEELAQLAPPQSWIVKKGRRL